MNLEVQTEGIKKTKTDSGYTLDFGVITVGSEATADISITGVEQLALESTCGCTVIDPDEFGNAKITYTRTSNRGTFAKTIVAKYKTEGKKKQSEIKIKGNVN